MRVVIGGIAHETSTFSVVPTTLADFRQRECSEGADLLARLGGTRTPIGGFLDAARDEDFEVVPTIMASAVPGGIVTAEATEYLTGRLVAGLRAALAGGPVDGVLLALHGAMVSALDDDAESYILRAVRAVVGPDLPVIAELDLHGNVTRELVDLATALIAYDEYPHTDPYDRGREAGRLMARIVREGVRPTAALARLPLMAGLQRQYTGAEPMLGVKRLAHELEAEPGVLNVSYLPGFAWADIPAMAFSVVVTTDGDPARARALADRLASYIWDRRAEFVVRPVPVDQAVGEALTAPRGPVVLADIGDNPGGGTPADGTVLLAALLRHGARRAALAILADPESAKQAITAGPGATLPLRLGGKVDNLHGAPLDVTARVVRVTDGRFRHTGPMSTGVEMNLGPTAVVALAGADGGEVQVVLTTYRYQPTDLEVFRSQGIEPTAQQILAVKSSVHFRAAFTPIAAQIVEVDTPGLTSPHLERLAFRRIPRPMYPLDGEATWAPV
ncbi:MAG TPA: M81 family metallopeptidase [Thermomicrobiales bacterium]|nr:M81 family metallopeptidase [Thermomicrobiales bacterium]